ncbi:hypothetical protein Tsp_03025 [Trichinella spiralis]|uniref:hypothetical protein n=1 Tax=Trichinella spiralis TaxID=6334 RepID=UPI0001EFB3FB|nr:hypothetical protein Tsp_03025 [Trichinella spiralis]
MPLNCTPNAISTLMSNGLLYWRWQGRLSGALAVGQLGIDDHLLFDLSNLQFNAHLLAVVGERFPGRQFVFAGEEQKPRRLFTVPDNHHLQQAGHQRHAHRHRPQLGASNAEHDLQYRPAHATVLDRRQLADEHRRQTQRAAQRDAQQQSTDDEQFERVGKFSNHRQHRAQRTQTSCGDQAAPTPQSFGNGPGHQRPDHGANLQRCAGQRPQHGHFRINQRNTIVSRVGFVDPVLQFDGDVVDHRVAVKLKLRPKTDRTDRDQQIQLHL